MLDRSAGESASRPGSILYFQVDDIQAMHQELVNRGVAFRQPPHRIAKLPDREVWMAFFDDPEGNILALMSEPRRA
jgi:methylmalonyl-CoA/ethylmalonyl-CoA epimerase